MFGLIFAGSIAIPSYEAGRSEQKHVYDARRRIGDVK